MPTNDPDTLLAQAAEAIRLVEAQCRKWYAEGSIGSASEAACKSTERGALPLMRAMLHEAETLRFGGAGLRTALCEQIIRVANEITGEQP